MINYVLYHDKCTDGAASVYAAWDCLGDEAVYLPINYNEPLPDMELNESSIVYILDFCISFKEYLALKQQCHKVIIIDHHEALDTQFLIGLCYYYITTTFKLSKVFIDHTKLITILLYLVTHYKSVLEYICSQTDTDIPIFDTSKSGSLLTWEYFHFFRPAPDIIKFVSDRDLWQFKREDTKAAIEGLKLNGDMNDMEYWHRLANDTTYLYNCIQSGRIILKNKLQECTKFIKDKTSYKVTTLEGYKVAIYNNTTSVNELAEALYTDEDLNIDMTINYYIRANGTIKLSLRSKNPSNADTRIIAGLYGGSGHKHSSGASLSQQQSLEFLEYLQGL